MAPGPIPWRLYSDQPSGEASLSKTATSSLAAGVAAALLVCGSAQAAGANRAWVSGHGTDAAGCGAPTAPCRSLQYTHDHIVVAGGEIDILDPAGYGAITITKGISIVNDGVGTAGVQATSGDAITINAGTGAVVLRGLDVEAQGGAVNGIHFIAGGSLTVQDSTIKGFGVAGISYEPTTAGYLFVSDGTASSQGVTIDATLADSTLAHNATLGAESAANNATVFLMVH